MKTIFKTLIIYNLAFTVISLSFGEGWGEASAQNIGINGTGGNAHPSALLDIDAVATPSLGLLIPRIALQAINVASPVTSPATSLLVYNTASAGTSTNAVSAGYYYWDGVKWVRFSYNTPGSLGDAWTTLGNSSTNSSTNFLGTIDTQDFVVKTNNIERMRVLSTGNIGIGTAAPTASLHIVATATNTGFQLRDGTEGANKILVSDASGKASWGNINTIITSTINGFSGGGFSSNGYHSVVDLHKGNAAEGNHFVLLDDGTVLGWGPETQGQIGDGIDNNPKPLPVIVNLPAPCNEIVTDWYSTYFIMQNGDVYACGYNGFGQLGNGNFISQYNPTKVLNVSNVTKLETSKSGYWGNGLSMCALTSSGQVWTWGYNGFGQLGNGNTTSQSSPVMIFPNNIIDIAGAGDNYGNFCAIKNDSTIQCWGYNGYGELGIGNTTSQSTPQAVPSLTKVKHIQAVSYGGGTRRCAIRNNGDLYCWGYNAHGQVGNGSTTAQLTPTFITNNIKQIALGAGSTYALKNDGSLYSWGYNGWGQLGINNTTNQTSPQLINTISGIDTVITSIDCTNSGGNIYGVAWAIKNNGNTVYSWGYNGAGAIGDGTITNKLIPVQINLFNVKKISCINGSLPNYTNVIALLKDGGVKCWGYGQNGANAGSGGNINIDVFFPQLIKR